MLHLHPKRSLEIIGMLTIFLALTMAKTQASTVEDILKNSPHTTQNDRNLAYGGCAEDPYGILERYKGGGANRCSPNGIQITPSSSGVGGIDSALACRLTKLFKAATDKGCRVTITSAYRSESTQQCMCGSGRTGCAAAGSSCHQPGRAVDVSSSCIGWLRMVAPQFQLVFPYYGDHIQCAEHPGANTRSCNRPCNGGASINPDLSRYPAPSQVPETYWRPPSGAPSSGLSDQFRDALGAQQSQPICQLPGGGGSVPCSSIMNPAGTQTPPPMTPIAPPAPLPQTQSPSQYLQGSASPSPVSDTLKIPTFTDLGSLFGSTSSSTKDKPSPFSQIENIAEPVSSAIDTGRAGDPLVLTISGEDAKTLTETQKLNKLGETKGLQPTSPGAQQTFTSGDLKSNAPSFVQSSGFESTLQKMKETLLNILAYLRPFGRPAAPEQELYGE